MNQTAEFLSQIVHYLIYICIVTKLNLENKMNQNTSRSTRRPTNGLHINLSNIKYDSTCITLCLPTHLACRACMKDACVHTHTRKKRKSSQRQKNPRNRCQQYWTTKWTQGPLATTAHLATHNRVRGYLGIEKDVILECFNLYEANDSITNSGKKLIQQECSDNIRCEQECTGVQDLNASSISARSSTQHTHTNDMQHSPENDHNSQTQTIPNVPQHEQQQLEIPICDYIVRNMQEFIRPTKKGRKRKQAANAMHVLLTAATYTMDESSGRNEQVRKELGFANTSYYKPRNNSHQNLETYNPPEENQYNNTMTKLKRECVDLFCHSDESSTIDSNSCTPIIVKGVEHAGRIWTTNTVKEQYQIFKQSSAVQKFKQINRNFKIPSISFFQKNVCKCVSKLKMHSCVDVISSSVLHHMRALGKFIRNNKRISDKLEDCECQLHTNLPKTQQWQSHLNGRVEEFVESVCCNRKSHPDLAYGAGSSVRIPKLLPWDCANGICGECGIEKN